MKAPLDLLERAHNAQSARRLKEQRLHTPQRWQQLRALTHSQPLAKKTEHLADVWIKDENHMMEYVEKMAPEISPEYAAFEQTMLDWHGMNVWDQETFRSFTQVFPHVETADIGVIPFGVLMMLWGQDPDFLKDKERVYAFLNRYRQFKIPGSRETPLPSWD